MPVSHPKIAVVARRLHANSTRHVARVAARRKTGVGWLSASRRAASSLLRVIADWERVVSLDQFFSGMQSRAQELPEEQRHEVLKRLKLVREFVGTQDPLAFFRPWNAPP